VSSDRIEGVGASPASPGAEGVSDAVALAVSGEAEVTAAEPVDEPEDDPAERAEIRAVLIDMGGVILDLGEARGLPWGELDRRGREALVERIANAGGRVGEHDLDRWLFDPWRRGYARRRRTGREEPWGPHLARLQRSAGVEVSRGGLLEAWVRPYLAEIRVLPGAQEALSRLVTADLSLALVSNVPMPGSFYRRVLERQGLAPFFRRLLFSYDQGSRKPGPMMLQRALSSMGIDPDGAVMVGDRRSTDIAAGRAAGLRTVWVDSPDVDGPEPDRVIASLAELPELLGV